MEVKVLEMDGENRRLSLGHKQLEENPWEVFETVFILDSIHQGTVLSIMEKGALIALPYGVEGFAPTRHLAKPDGGSLKVDETADFKVLEFSKDNKKIILSHSKVNEEVAANERATEDEAKKSAAKSEKASVKKIKDSIEKSTLGDISALSDLKDQMDSAAAKKSEKEKE